MLAVYGRRSLAVKRLLGGGLGGAVSEGKDSRLVRCTTAPSRLCVCIDVGGYGIYAGGVRQVAAWWRFVQVPWFRRPRLFRWLVWAWSRWLFGARSRLIAPRRGPPQAVVLSDDVVWPADAHGRAAAGQAATAEQWVRLWVGGGGGGTAAASLASVRACGAVFL